MLTNKRLWLNILLIIIVASAMMFPLLGDVPLLDPDEPVYAETAREMVQFNDFVSPRIYGDFWYDKPPMYYWMVAGSFKVFGVNEFASRLPSALLAVAGAVLTYVAGRNFFGERGGTLAGLILATSLEYFYLGKAAVTDITLTFFLTASLFAFLHNRYYLFYFCAALAVVTKGPIGVIFCVAIIMLYIAVTGKWVLLKNMKLVSGAVLFLLVALPWYLLMYSYHGMAFIETFLGFHNLTRFLQPEHPSGTLWYYYIPVLILGFFPWTSFLGQAVRSALKETGPAHDSLIFMVIWALVVFLFFSTSQTKLVSYILPMYPPLALIVGWYFDKIWSHIQFRGLTWSALVQTLVSFMFVAGLFYAGKFVMPELHHVVTAIAGLFIMAVMLVWWFTYHRNFRSVFATYILTMVILSGYIMIQLFPIIVPAYSMKSFVDNFNQQYDEQSTIYVAKSYRPGFVFYSQLSSKEISTGDSLETLLNNKTEGFFIVKAKDYNTLPAPLKSNVRVLATQQDKTLLVSRVAD